METAGSSTDNIQVAVEKQSFSQTVRSYGRRSLAWTTVLAATIAGVLLLSTFQNRYSSSSAHALLEGYGVIIGICIVYCLWVQYNVTREQRFLLSTIAFSGVSLAALVHVVRSSLFPGDSSQFLMVGMRYSTGWHIAAAVLLIMAAGNNGVNNAQTYRRTGGRALITSLVFSICVMVVPLVFDPEWLHLRSILPPPFASALNGLWTDLMSLRSLSVLGMGAFTLALITHMRGHAEQEDEFSKRLVPFLTLAVSAGAASLASRNSFDPAWWASHGLFICGLMVLLIEVGMQFGSSYADAQSRIRHMEAVHYMSSRLTNTLDLRVVLLALVSDTASMLSAKFASVMLSDDSGRNLTTEVTYGLPESPLRKREPQEVEGQGYPKFFSGHTAMAFREKRICMVDDVFTDVEFLPWKVLARHDGYAVSVPLVYHDLALGVLNLFFEKHVPLNDEKIKLFQTLASSASVSIVNAQLYDRTLNESEEGDALFGLRLAS